MRAFIRSFVALALVSSSSLAMAPAAGAAAAPPPLQFTYTVLSTTTGLCRTPNLAAIKNNTNRNGTYTVGQQIGSSYTISASVSVTVGDLAKLSATLGYSATGSWTYTASGTHTLRPGETLALRGLFTRRYFKQTSNWPSIYPTKYGYAYRPTGVCTVIY